MISAEFREHIINYINTDNETKVKRIVATYNDKWAAMLAINAVTSCGMREANRIYDVHKQKQL